MRDTQPVVMSSRLRNTLLILLAGNAVGAGAGLMRHATVRQNVITTLNLAFLEIAASLDIAFSALDIVFSALDIVFSARAVIAGVLFVAGVVWTFAVTGVVFGVVLFTSAFLLVLVVVVAAVGVFIRTGACVGGDGEGIVNTL